MHRDTTKKGKRQTRIKTVASIRKERRLNLNRHGTSTAQQRTLTTTHRLPQSLHLGYYNLVTRLPWTRYAVVQGVRLLYSTMDMHMHKSNHHHRATFNQFKRNRRNGKNNQVKKITNEGGEDRGWWCFPCSFLEIPTRLGFFPFSTSVLPPWGSQAFGWDIYNGTDIIIQGVTHRIK